MNKLAIGLACIFVALICFVAVSLDNSARPTPAQDDAAFEEWHNMDPIAQDIVCDLLETHGEDAVRVSMTENGLSPSEVRARLDLMERECE